MTKYLCPNCNHDTVHHSDTVKIKMCVDKCECPFIREEVRKLIFIDTCIAMTVDAIKEVFAKKVKV